MLAAAGIDLLICALTMGLTALVSRWVGRVSVVDVVWGGRCTRHPKCFGDACVWWGIWLAGALSVLLPLPPRRP